MKVFIAMWAVGRKGELIRVRPPLLLPKVNWNYLVFTGSRVHKQLTQTECTSSSLSGNFCAQVVLSFLAIFLDSAFLLNFIWSFWKTRVIS